MYIYTAIVFHKGLITLIKTNRGPLSAYPVWVRSWVAFFRFLSRLNASLPRVKYRIPRKHGKADFPLFPKEISDSVEHFPNVTFSRKFPRISSDKISDDLFLDFEFPPYFRYFNAFPLYFGNSFFP